LSSQINYKLKTIILFQKLSPGGWYHFLPGAWRHAVPLFASRSYATDRGNLLASALWRELIGHTVKIFVSINT